MPLGINGTNAVTEEMILNIVNVTDPSNLWININMDIYGGIFFFVMLVVLFTILTISAYRKDPNDLFRSLFYSGARVSIIAILMGGIFSVASGNWRGLISDPYMWIFPIITALLGFYLRTKY